MERRPTDADVDLVLARIQARWPADRTERNLMATLERLGLRPRRAGAQRSRWLRRRFRRRAAH